MAQGQSNIPSKAVSFGKRLSIWLLISARVFWNAVTERTLYIVMKNPVIPSTAQVALTPLLFSAMDLWLNGSTITAVHKMTAAIRVKVRIKLTPWRFMILFQSKEIGSWAARSRGAARSRSALTAMPTPPSRSPTVLPLNEVCRIRTSVFWTRGLQPWAHGSHGPAWQFWEQRWRQDSGLKQGDPQEFGGCSFLLTTPSEVAHPACD